MLVVVRLEFRLLGLKQLKLLIMCYKVLHVIGLSYNFIYICIYTCNCSMCLMCFHFVFTAVWWEYDFMLEIMYDFVFLYHIIAFVNWKFYNISRGINLFLLCILSNYTNRGTEYLDISIFATKSECYSWLSNIQQTCGVLCMPLV